MYIGLQVKYPLLSSGFTKLVYSRQTVEKHTNAKFHENSAIGSWVLPCGWADRRTDMTKLKVAFRKLAYAPKKNQP